MHAYPSSKGGPSFQKGTGGQHCMIDPVLIQQCWFIMFYSVSYVISSVSYECIFFDFCHGVASSTIASCSCSWQQWRLFLTAGFGRGVNEWEEAGAILAIRSVNSGGPSPSVLCLTRMMLLLSCNLIYFKTLCYVGFMWTTAGTCRSQSQDRS